MPRLPLEGSIDLTYRCNNTCRHCWLWLPENAPEKQEELSFDEIRRIADEARAMGCRRWNISGGEPMLRPDFPEIFEYLTSRSASYGLNTNGTLITPAIAQLMKRKGSKMVALYGADAEVYDDVTHHPGGFEQAMQGIAYLKEAGAGFIVQLIPMRANWHQWDRMLELAKSLSPDWRVGAAWLYLSASGSPVRNAQIAAQRLHARDVVALDPPNSSYDERLAEMEAAEPCGRVRPGDDRLFAACIDTRRDFHIDPYGGMTFCCFVKDRTMRYDLRRGGQEYLENCGACKTREDCRWCGVYGYLEHGRFSAPVEPLCEAARSTQQYKDAWQRHHRRHFEIAGITIQVDSDLPITDETFHPKFRSFTVEAPGPDTVTIHHHFEVPALNGRDLGQQVYRRPPWTIFKKNRTWVYVGASSEAEDSGPRRVAILNEDHSRAILYSDAAQEFKDGNVNSLTLLGRDEILLARLLAHRGGGIFHSSGVILEGNGLLFVGHSGAGKSTIVKMLQNRAVVLCDDRVIVRRWPEGFRLHGTWIHGEVPNVCGLSAPLRAVFLLEQSLRNRIVETGHRRAALSRLLGCLVKPLATADWWDKAILLIDSLTREVPCYQLEFDKSGAIAAVLEDWIRRQPGETGAT
jgi:MoaA/NifB/PqqE/SkfB family radical SAM enzyme